MSILIIGSKGFIGSHLTDFFREKGYKVLGCDIYQNFYELNYYKVDLNNPNYDIIFENNQIIYCINCSGSASVQLSFEDPINDYLSNTVNVYKILNTIRKHSPLTKFINLSSAAVYGNPVDLPIKENSILSPVSPYGFHKLQSEQICKEFHDFYNLNVCSLRIFSAYGVGLKKQLFWDLFQKLQKNDPILLFGTGIETRDFIHVDDISLVINLIINKGSFDAEVYNIGTGNCITIKEVARLFFNQFDEKINFKFVDKVKVGDPKYWQADITKISNLGFRQTISIDSGIKKYTKWLKELS